MDIIISLSEDQPSVEMTEQARLAEQRAEKLRLERTYGEEGISDKEIEQREKDRIETENEKRENNPNRLPDRIPAELGSSKVTENDSATAITNRHDNLPQSKI